jgi:ubiquitin carboxyl-terminal hydrolase 7
MRARHLSSLLNVAISCQVVFRVLGDAASSSRLCPIGLKNLGNTCYLNAQLQCHFHIPRVRQLIMEQPCTAWSESMETTEIQPSAIESNQAPTQESATLQALRHLFRDMHQSTFPVAPTNLCSTLGINAFEQQDSQEFWKLLLPAIALPSLSDLYQGAYIDYIIALDGSNRERRREETFLDLSLEVQSSGSVDKALASLFGEPELLSVAQGNGWRPEKGADKVDAHKGSLLTANGLPSILQLHLKRFHYDWNTDATTKLNNPFEFPLELDMQSLCKEDSQNKSGPLPVYDLQSIVIHVGEYGAGHYYAYVRPDVTGDHWYRFDDDQVVPVSFDEVLADAANTAKPTAASCKGWFARVKRALFQSSASYGYGGRTSSAYVLQYVRRCDVPLLYLNDS